MKRTSCTSFRIFELPTEVLRGPLVQSGSSKSQHRQTPKVVLQKSHASFRITFRPPGAEDRGRNRLKGSSGPLGCFTRFCLCERKKSVVKNTGSWQGGSFQRRPKIDAMSTLCDAIHSSPAPGGDSGPVLFSCCSAKLWCLLRRGAQGRMRGRVCCEAARGRSGHQRRQQHTGCRQAGTAIPPSANVSADLA